MIKGVPIVRLATLMCVVHLPLLKASLMGADQPSRNPYIFPDSSWTADWRNFDAAEVVVSIKGCGDLILPKKYDYAPWNRGVFVRACSLYNVAHSE